MEKYLKKYKTNYILCQHKKERTRFYLVTNINNIIDTIQLEIINEFEKKYISVNKEDLYDYVFLDLGLKDIEHYHKNYLEMDNLLKNTKNSFFISKSKIENSFIKLLRINENGYFDFIYCTYNGKDTDIVRKSIYTIDDYIWIEKVDLLRMKKTINELFNEEKKKVLTNIKSTTNIGKDKITMKVVSETYTTIKYREVSIINVPINNVSLIILEKIKKNIDNLKLSENIESKTILFELNYLSYVKSVGIDFDGTIVTNEFPELGVVKENVVKTIDRIFESGNEVVIWTCREPYIIKDFLDENNIKYNKINENTDNCINQWNNNPKKVGVDLFIDDKNIFCKEINWFEIELELERLRIIDDK